MSFERPTGPASGLGAEPAPTPAPAEGPVAPGGITPGMRLQILSTEHWSLLASRSLAWNESFSRAGMFLSTLSGSIVALALVAQATEFGEGFRVFGLVILPVVLFIGIGTTLRMGIANYHDAVCVLGMNRIRAGYLELAPDLGRFFVMGTTDDERGMLRTMAIEPRTPVLVQMIASSPMLISVVNGVLTGGIASLLTIQLGGQPGLAFGLGVVAFFMAVAAALAYGRREMGQSRERFRPVFPSADPAPRPAQPTD